MGLLLSRLRRRPAAPSDKDRMAAQDFVDRKVRDNKVVVFSKSYCPYCKKAKHALLSLLAPEQFDVEELDKRGDGDAIQDYLLQLTGGRSVPRVFIGGKFIGGGDDTQRMAANGELKAALVSVGVL